MYYDFRTDIKLIAEDFNNAYCRCLEKKDSHIDEFGRLISKVLNVPALVNGAFACELYLKSLLGKKAKKTHLLEELYELLKTPEKEALKSIILEKLEKAELKEGFAYYLKNISNLFYYWRYISEKIDFGKLGVNLSLKTLDCFLSGIKTYVDSIHK